MSRKEGTPFLEKTAKVAAVTAPLVGMGGSGYKAIEAASEGRLGTAAIYTGLTTVFALAEMGVSRLMANSNDRSTLPEEPPSTPGPV